MNFQILNRLPIVCCCRLCYTSSITHVAEDGLLYCPNCSTQIEEDNNNFVEKEEIKTLSLDEILNHISSSKPALNTEEDIIKGILGEDISEGKTRRKRYRKFKDINLI